MDEITASDFICIWTLDGTAHVGLLLRVNGSTRLWRVGKAVVPVTTICGLELAQ
jgi:hypothetical protein